jgi:hypothetical protein
VYSAAAVHRFSASQLHSHPFVRSQYHAFERLFSNGSAEQKKFAERLAFISQALEKNAEGESPSGPAADVVQARSANASTGQPTSRMAETAAILAATEASILHLINKKIQVDPKTMLAM